MPTGSGIALLLYEHVFPFADLDLCDPRNSVYEGGDFGPLQVECGLLHGCRARFDGGLGPKLGLNLVIQLALGNGSSLCKRCIPLHIESAFSQLCLRLRKITLCAVEGCHEGPRVYFKQYFAFANERTFSVVLPDYVA